MDDFVIAFGLVVAACVVGAVWQNVTTPNLRCRWLGHGLLIRDGWGIE